VAHGIVGLPAPPRGHRHPPSCYGRRALAAWVSRLRDLFGREEDVYVYFNNDTRACAVRNAQLFVRLATAAGRHVS
jgi:uncharacterized protein YecE (DUF72 family)